MARGSLSYLQKSLTNRRWEYLLCLNVVSKIQISLFVHVFWRFVAIVTRPCLRPRLPGFACAFIAAVVYGADGLWQHEWCAQGERLTTPINGSLEHAVLGALNIKLHYYRSKVSRVTTLGSEICPSDVQKEGVGLPNQDSMKDRYATCEAGCRSSPVRTGNSTSYPFPYLQNRAKRICNVIPTLPRYVSTKLHSFSCHSLRY